MTAVLELRGVVRQYKSEGGVLRVLEGADLTLNQGELVGLIGPSGSGKSTLLHTAGLLEKPEDGEVFLEGENCMTLNDAGRTRLRREKLGFVYQFHHLLPEFTAWENVAMPLLIRREARESAMSAGRELPERVSSLKQVATRIACEVDRICRMSRRIQSSGEVIHWQIGRASCRERV